MYMYVHLINFVKLHKSCINISMIDLEAIQQYEKMLSIEEALMGAEADVNVEEITGVSCLSVYIYTYVVMSCIVHIHVYIRT